MNKTAIEIFDTYKTKIVEVEFNEGSDAIKKYSQFVSGYLDISPNDNGNVLKLNITNDGQRRIYSITPDKESLLKDEGFLVSDIKGILYPPPPNRKEGNINP